MARNGETQKLGPTRFVRHANRWQHLDADGRLIGEPYTSVYVHPKHDIAEVQKRWGPPYFIDAEGNTLGEVGEVLLAGNRGRHVDGPGDIFWIGFSDGDLATAFMPGGKIIGEFVILGAPHEDIRWVCSRSGKWRLLAADGTFREPEGVECAYDFFNGLTLVQIDGRCAFLNATGKPAWQKNYANAADFHDGRAWVEEPEGWMLIDTQGRRVGDGAYEDLDDGRRAYTIVAKGSERFIVRRQDGTRRPDESFEEVVRYGDGKQREYRFVVKKAGRFEHLDAATGERWSYDAKADFARAMRGL